MTVSQLFMITSYRKQKVLLLAKQEPTSKVKSSSTTSSVFKKIITPNTTLPYNPESLIATWFGGIWPLKNPSKTQYQHPNIPHSLPIPHKSDMHLSDWQTQLKINPYLTNKLPTRLIRSPIPNSLRSKIYLTMLPNHQFITEKLFSVSKRRGRNIIERRVQPCLKEGTLVGMAGDVLEVFSEGRRIFNEGFVKGNREVVREVEGILMAFCVQRMEVGQRKSVTRVVAFLYAYLRSPLQVFIHICHICCTRPYSSFLLNNHPQITHFLHLIFSQLSIKSPSLYRLLEKHRSLFTSYLSHWVRHLFLPLFFDESTPYLDLLYSLETLEMVINRKDFLVDRVMNYLFLRKFGEREVGRVCVAVLLGLERELLGKGETDGEQVEGVLRRAKKYIDVGVFDKYLF